MYRVLMPLAVVGLMAVPPGAGAQSLTQPLFPSTQTVFPPKTAPGAFTPAPVSSLSVQQLNPTLRAGGAGDAGPMNATPFSAMLSPVLTGSQEAEALSASREGRDPIAATGSGWRD